MFMSLSLDIVLDAGSILFETRYDDFASNTSPKVPMTGSLRWCWMDNMIIPMNCESVMFMPSPLQASLSLCSSAM